MTEEHQLKIPYDDLKYISLECPCGTEITVNISTDDSLKADWKNKGMRCTICTRPIDSNIKNGLEHFSDWYDCIKQSGQQVYFRVIAAR